MKKLFICSLLLCIPLMLIGCGKTGQLEDNISEITKTYYQGSDQSGQVHASISVGQREEPYIIDGRHQPLCDFSLFVINFDQLLEDEEITVELAINGETQEFVMYLNPVGHQYMADLGYALGDNDKVSVTYQDYNINFDNVSDDFTISWSQALEIAKENLGERLDAFYQENNFKGECYLKILTEQNDNFDDLFWYFSVVGQNNEVANVVIDVKSGEVLVD